MTVSQWSCDVCYPHSAASVAALREQGAKQHVFQLVDLCKSREADEKPPQRSIRLSDPAASGCTCRMRRPWHSHAASGKDANNLPSAPLETGPAPQAAHPQEQEVLAAYQGYWDAILAANDPPDPSHPALRQYATGAAYESVFSVQTSRCPCQALRRPAGLICENRAQVISIQGDVATVRNCAIGKALNDKTEIQLATVTLVREGGIWKVCHIKLEQTWHGVAG
jgi:hypothetical protein